LLDAVVAYFKPQRVILFGSTARGEAGPDSDIDLLVIVDDDTPAEKVTLRAGYEARRSYHHPADVILAQIDIRRLAGNDTLRCRSGIIHCEACARETVSPRLRSSSQRLASRRRASASSAS